jgi:hypothetical protein
MSLLEMMCHLYFIFCTLPKLKHMCFFIPYHCDNLYIQDVALLENFDREKKNNIISRH